MSITPKRNPVIDILKAMASQLIVLHHLVLYTPMTPWLEEKMPNLIGLIGNQARYVVQIFLVIGGYLAAQSLFKSLTSEQAKLSSATSVLKVLWKRYLRLAKPFWAALLAVVLLAWFASHIAKHAEIPTSPSLVQLLSHFLFLHDIVGVEALSAGVWYVAIDFQLFALFVGLTWAAHQLAPHLKVRSEHLMLALVTLIACASLLWWNTKPQMDEWAWYFAGSYGLGVLAQWARQKKHRLNMTLFIITVLAGALILQMRERLVLTGITALVLMYSDTLQHWVRTLNIRPVRWLGDISYSTFLIHYAVAMVCSSVVLALHLNSFTTNSLAFLCTWALSISAGWVLHRFVESRG